MSGQSIPVTPLEGWIAGKIGLEQQPLTTKELQAYQLTRLNDTIALVQKKSAFYRRLLGSAKISLSSLRQLAELPLTSPEQLRSAPFEFLCVPQDEVERIVTLPTSGTTGQPKRIFFTAADQELTRDFFHHGMSTLVDPGDRVLILLPGSLPGSVGALLEEALARMGVTGIPHGPVTDPPHTLDVMRRERVTALVGIPVQVLWLARLSSSVQTDHARRTRQQGSGCVAAEALRLKSVLLSTDRVPQVAVEVIENTWGCRVYNHYGTTEMGLGGGVDCRGFAGYHLREADLLFEVVDPVFGRPVPEGAAGEVVFTTLTRAAMPLVRYRTGDVGSFVPGRCPCGTRLRRLAHVHERLDGGVALPGGKTIRQRDLDEALLAIESLADFRTRLMETGVGGNLVVEVRSYEGTIDRWKDQAVQALRGIPALATELNRGTLSLEVRQWDPSEGGTSTGTAKRKIELTTGAMR